MDGGNRVDPRLLARTFVALADTLGEGFDVVEFLELLVDRTVELLEVSAVGLMLADPQGNLQVMAASTEAMFKLELFQQERGEGPCVDCYRTGVPVGHSALAQAGERWPQFAPLAVETGFGSVLALPMRLRTEVLGAFNMFHTSPGGLGSLATEIGQALVDVATIGLIQERAERAHEVLVEQLTGALESRVLIEQAKGILAERHRIDPAEAFTLLRQAARRERRKLTELAGAVLEGKVGNLLGATPGPRPNRPT